MAVNTTPIFVLTPFVQGVVISTANAALDGSGTLASLITGGTNGSRVDWVRFIATQTSTQDVINIFIYNGTNNRLFDQVLVPPNITPSVANQAWQATWYPPTGEPLFFKAAHILKASTNNGQTYHCNFGGGDY